MALGGGTFLVQNKILPGSYINFVSTNTTGTVFGDRGVCAAPLDLGWGPTDEVFEVKAEDFEKNSLKIFGYPYTDAAMKPYRDLFKNAQSCLFYRLLTGGKKATSTYADAKYAGERGNNIFVTIAKNADNADYYDVCTYIRTIDNSVEANKIYDLTKTIPADIINVGDKAKIEQDTSDPSNPYACVIDGARDGTDFDSTGKPIGRALGFIGVMVPCKIKVTCIDGTQQYLKIFAKGSSASTISPSASGSIATFTIPANGLAAADIYLYGTSKIRITKIEIVYDGAVSDTLVDKQTVSTMDKLADNDFVTWKKSASLSETAGTLLSGGTRSVSDGQAYQNFLNAMEGQQYNMLICDSNNDVIKSLFVNYTKRLRDNVGIKFQTVVFNYASDYEGVINLTTKAQEATAGLVWWVAGAEAGCAVNKSCTNKKYDGEYTPLCTDTQSELEQAINNGELKLHKVGTDYRLLTDINSFITVTSEKGPDFSSNQTIRVCDQIGTDIATMFNTYYLGIMPNDKAGRIAFWGDIVKYAKKLEALRAIEDFKDTDVTVSQGDTKKSVVVIFPITPVNAMEQLYMTVIVN